MAAMIWKDIKGYEGLYMISNTGLVKSLAREIHTYSATGKPFVRKSKEFILGKCKDAYGYHRARLFNNGKSEWFKVHRLVAHHFIGESDLAINHKDMNKENNHVDNLEYTTLAENNYHARRNRKWNTDAISGENHYGSKLTKSDVLKIKKLKGNLSSCKVAKIFKVSPRNIRMIWQGHTWKHI
jgi:hypothetical protein